MHAEDRLIHFSTELMHAPVQHKVPALQKLYYDLSQTLAAYDSTDFSVPPQFRFHSRRDKSHSVALFLPDRIVVIEEWAGIALSDFSEKIREVGLRALSGLGIAFFAAQTVTLRSTFSLTHFNDARVFLLDHMCGQADQIAPFLKRPVSTGGIRFVLPETPENPGTLHILIESFRHNVREVFVEVKGVYLNQRIDVTSIGTAQSRLQAVRAYICDNIFPYLNQYDVPAEDSV